MSVGGTTPGSIQNTLGEAGELIPGLGFTILPDSNTGPAKSTLQLMAWEENRPAKLHTNAQSIHLPVNLNASVFRQEIPSVHLETAPGIGQSLETERPVSFVLELILLQVSLRKGETI